MIILSLTFALIMIVLVGRFGLTGLTRLATLNFRGGLLVLLACVAQLISILTQQQQFLLILISAGLLVGFGWLNRQHLGIVVAMIGIALNMVVMAANGGIMPVSTAAVAQAFGEEADSVTLVHLSKGSIVDDSEAVLPWLGDRLLLPGPLARVAAWSIGDVLLIAGVSWLLWRTMKGHNYDRHTLWNHAPTP